VHLFLMFVDTSIAYKKSIRYTFLLRFISQMLGIRCFFNILSILFRCFLHKLFYASCILSVHFVHGSIVLGHPFCCHYDIGSALFPLSEYFTESKGITIAAGNCNFLHRQICKCELLFSSGNSKFCQKIFRRDSKTVHKYCI